MDLALWIAMGAEIICAGIAVYYGIKNKNQLMGSWIVR